MRGRPGENVREPGSGEETSGSGAVRGGDYAHQSLEVLAGLLGADSDSVDLDTLFDAVQAVAGDGEAPTGAGGEQPAGAMEVAGDDAEGLPTRIIDDGSSSTVYDKLVDTGLADFDGLGLDGLIDIFNVDS